MKAIIVELKGTCAAALSDEGCVVKVVNQNYVIGQVIQMKEKTAHGVKFAMRIAAIAAAFVLTFSLGAGSYAYFAPESYVSLDVNPSIEYTLNMFGRVLSVNAVNEDGAQILQEVNLKDFNNKTIEEAIQLTLAEIDKEGYFNGDVKGGIVIATSGKNHNKAEEMADTLGEIVKAQCKAGQKDVKVETLVADRKMMDEAKALGVTPGKLRLVQELQEDYTGKEPFDVAAWLKKPVKEIMAEAERLDAAEDALEDEQDALEDAKDKADHEKDAAEKKADAEKETAEKLADEKKDAAEKAAEAKEKEMEKAAEAKEKAEERAAKKAEKEKEAAEKAKEEANEQADAAEDVD